MANEFTKLTEKDIVESVSENGHLFAEDGGKIVRIPAAGVGGGVVVYYVENPSGDMYLYKDSSFTEKITYDEINDVYTKSTILLYWSNEYQKAVFYPTCVTDIGDYFEVDFVGFGDEGTGYTSEWTESAGPQ